MSISFKYHEDPCINARARVVNARAHVLLRVRAFKTHLRALNANISATEARIFMKIYVVVNYYLVSLSFKFYEDPCINAHVPVVNARAHVLLRVRAFTTGARAFMKES